MLYEIKQHKYIDCMKECWLERQYQARTCRKSKLCFNTIQYANTDARV